MSDAQEHGESNLKKKSWVLKITLGLAGCALVLILIGSVFGSNESNAKPTTTKSGPAVGTTWFAGIETNVCGKVQQLLAVSEPSSKNGLTSLGDGVIKLSPMSALDAEQMATLGQFYKEFNSGRGIEFGPTVSSTSLNDGIHTYENGDACPSGTPLAGMPGQVKIAVWSSYAYNLGGKPDLIAQDPRSVKFHDHDFITVSFVPQSVTPTKPSTIVFTNVNLATSGQPLQSGYGPPPTEATTVPVNSALHNWAVSFYNSSWSSCAPEWNDLKTNYDAASGPYGINTTQIIDNDCGSLKGNSPDASLNNLIDTFTSDELNWSIDVVNTGNGMYADDFRTFDNHFKQLNARIMQEMKN